MSVNEQVNETLAMMDDLDIVLERDAEARRVVRREKAEYRARRAHYFKDLPILVVGNDDVQLDRLRQQQKDGKQPLAPLQVEELLYRQELQKDRKKAKRDKAKKKRKQNRYNRAHKR